MSEIERLRDRIEELETLLGLRLSLPNVLGLTPIEEKIVGLLVARDIVSRDYIHSCLYGHLPECDQPEPKTVEVHICKIRNKLKARGFFGIRNRYNVGYYIEAATRAALKEYQVAA